MFYKQQLALLMFLTSLSAFSHRSADGTWEYLGNEQEGILAQDTKDLPNSYGVFAFDQLALEVILTNATEGLDNNRVFVPKPDGSYAEFLFDESQVMDSRLAKKYPEIRTYKGTMAGNPSVSIRYDLTPAGFHAQISSPDGTYYVSPITDELYLSFYSKNYSSSLTFGCEEEHRATEEKDALVSSLKPLINYGTNLRTYRLAVAATGEYTTAVGGTKPLALASIATAVNFVTAIYEAEVGIRVQLVATNQNVIYTNAGTDPYTPASGNSTLLAQNQSTINSMIGTANFDVGHLFHALAGVTNYGAGLATISSACRTVSKARGVTTASRIGLTPINPFFYRVFAHELAHQFGANHTFNASCSGNRNDPTAYEPGSGTTMMSYSSGCSPYNIQPLADLYFHRISMEEIAAYLAGNGGLCGTSSSTGNSIPTANAGLDYTIPKSTPFILTGAGSDADPSNTLSYSWEQYNNDIIPGVYPLSTTTAGPVFRSFTPTTSTSRYFPNLTDILANTSPTWEVLPGVARSMVFSLVVRDNVGGASSDNMNITVSGTQGPFRVLSPNGGESLRASTTITWDKSNTDLAPISTSLVDILLSLDNGLTYPILLANDTANDGSEVVVLPALTSSQARIQVKAEGNIYFDVSNNPFTISP